jgi:hypothetical protein
MSHKKMAPGARVPTTLWHRPKVNSSGRQFGSTVDLWRACNNDVLVEYKQPEDVVLGLQMTSEGTTDLAINTLMLCHCCSEPHLLACILCIRLGNAYHPRQTFHNFCLFSDPEAKLFKKVDEDGET